MKKFLLLFVPILTIFYSLDALFVDAHYEYDVFPVYEETETLPKMEVENFHIQYGNGIVQYIYKLQTLLNEIQDPELPIEAELEKTQEKLEKILIGRKISFVLYSFVILLSFSSLFALLSNAWFSVFLNRFLYLFSFLIGIVNLIRGALHLNFVPNYALFSIAVNLCYIIILIYCIFIVKKYLLKNPLSYNSLFIASQQLEESGGGKISLPFEEKAEPSSNFFEKIRIFFKDLFLHKFRTVYHFLIIISVGFILGNFVYIPLFSLQKHYSKEFGYLLGGLLIVLSLFYIRNYYILGKEIEKSFLSNIAVSSAFLIYRFLRNLSLFFLVVLSITLFVIAFLFLLNYNINYLIDHGLIEKSVKL